MTQRVQLAAVMAAILSIGWLAAPARAIELFTNFNNGTELGTRPLDVDEMSPVRVHAWQGRWHGPLGRCFNDAGNAVPRSEYVPGQPPAGASFGSAAGSDAQARREPQGRGSILAGGGRLRAELQRIGATGQRSEAESASAGATHSTAPSGRMPVIVAPKSTNSNRGPDSSSNDDVLRSSNFLPPTESN